MSILSKDIPYGTLISILNITFFTFLYPSFITMNLLQFFLNLASESLFHGRLIVRCPTYIQPRKQGGGFHENNNFWGEI